MFDAAADDIHPPTPLTPPDPMIDAAERHMRILQEVAELAMGAARASSVLVMATAQAAAKIVAEVDGAWACEADKAYAVRGSREAADAFTRVARALRLTLALEMATAEKLRDLRAGIVPAREDRAERGAAQLGAPLDPFREQVREHVADALAEAAAGDGDIGSALDGARDLRERLTESDRFGPLLNRPLAEVVGLICAEIGVALDWSHWNGAGSTAPPATIPEVRRALFETLPLGVLPAVAQAPSAPPLARRLE